MSEAADRGMGRRAPVRLFPWLGDEDGVRAWLGLGLGLVLGLGLGLELGLGLGLGQGWGWGWG